MSGKPWTLLFSAMILMTITGPGWGKKPDKNTPVEESVCEALDGAAVGLCNAYCEVLDCDSDVPLGSEQSCGQVLGNFQRLTGDNPPCSTDPDTLCPELCIASMDEYLAIASSLPLDQHLGGCEYDESRQAGAISHIGFGPGPGLPFTFGNIAGGSCSAEIWYADGSVVTLPGSALTTTEQASCAVLFADDFTTLTGELCDVGP